VQDDDEVAVLHGPADSGFLPLSEAMVNIRATLARAAAGGVIAHGSRERLERLAKATFYQERTWPTLLEAGRTAGLPKDELAALETWLAGGRIDQKRLDAQAMLAAMRDFLAADPAPKRVEFHFEWTEMWDTVVGGTIAAADDTALSAARILDELRLQGEPYRAWRRRALARLLGLREGSRRRLAADPGAVRTLRDQLRLSHGLFARAELEAWVSANDLDAAAFERLLGEEVMIEALAAAAGPDLEQQMLSELRLAGDYGALARRAREKAAALQAAGWGEDAPDGEGPAPAALLPWHFEQRLGRAVPDDLAAYARELGFASLAAFHRALRKEWLYAGQR
jgi:TfuA-like protein